MDPAAPPQAAFGKYQITDRIHTGAVWEIYKARVAGAGGFQRTYALRRVLPSIANKAELVGPLVEEAKVAGLLSHANIVQILDLGQADGTYYVAMEYVNGVDLGHIIARCHERGTTIPVPHAVFIVIEILKGLEYAHPREVKRGNTKEHLRVVHRDLNSGNVLISLQGEVKIADFGISRVGQIIEKRLGAQHQGALLACSPEQISGADPDPRFDLFAVGELLYTMLTGRHPFLAATEAQTLDALRRARYEPLAKANPDVPYQLEVIVDTALKREPHDRFQSATAMKEALEQFFHAAGFIFSHATLASFVKQILQPPRQAHSALQVDPRGPGTLVIVPSDGARRPTDEPPTAPPVEPARVWPDASTLIKNPGHVVIDGPAPSPPKAAPSHVTLPARPQPNSGRAAAPFASRVPWLLAGVILAGLLVFLGAFIESRREELTRTNTPPLLVLDFPDGTTLILDGKRIDGNSPLRVPVAPDVEHRLEVRHPDSEPIHATFNLVPNTIQIVHFQTVDMPPAAQ